MKEKRLFELVVTDCLELVELLLVDVGSPGAMDRAIYEISLPCVFPLYMWLTAFINRLQD